MVSRRRNRIAWLLLVTGSLLLAACVYSSICEIRFKRSEHPWIPESRFSSGVFVWSEMKLSNKPGTSFGRFWEIPFVGGFWLLRDGLIMLRPWDTLPRFDGWAIFLNLWLLATILIVLGGGRLAFEFRRTRWRRRQGRCRCCGYSLEGNLSGTCPECGTVIHLAAWCTPPPRTADVWDAGRRDWAAKFSLAMYNPNYGAVPSNHRRAR